MTQWFRTAFVSFLVLSLCVPFSAGQVRADETGELKSEVALLRERLKQLEERLSRQEQQAAQAPRAGQILPATGGEGADVIPAWVRNLSLSGFVDASYVYNTQRPESRANSLRVFDTEANGFQPHALDLVVQKPVSEDSRVGFRGELIFGEDAEVLGSVTTGLGSQTDEVDLFQAYAEALLSVGNGLNVKFGKFATLHGAEVVASKDNWNFSRSFLFGYAEPITHTGVRLSYPFADWFTGIFGVSNGWDVVDDNNTAKTVEWQGSFIPSPKTTLSVTGMHGAEQTGDNRDKRHLFGLVAGYNPTDKLGFKLAYDYGHEQDAVSEGPDEDASWQGVAGYARYQFNDWYALAGRAEYFDDSDGVRTGVRTGARAATSVGLWELTLTNEFKVYKDLITRLEYRHDHASDAVFAAGSSFDNTQDTLSAEVIYPF